ncbi:MAG: Fic family protein, partial [Candidatus Thermoplasmatota archaeon]|nr:Fic family protein [Candidatus Thermoplasmatota archaeon]
MKEIKYIYVSATASYKGERKSFEKMVGRKGTDESLLADRIKFYSDLMSLKADLFKMYLEIKATKLDHLDKKCAIFLVLLPSFYRKYLSNLYPSELEKYKNNFDIRYIHNTNAIEGNTISLKETAMMLDYNLSPRSKKLREIHEIENFTKVLNYVRKYDKGINKKFMLKLHELITRNIDDNTAGNFRRISIGISGSKWEPVPAISVIEELDELLKWYKGGANKINPFELAGIFNHRFLQIHPFVDGNGRVARELFNFILQKNGFPPIIVPVKRRDDYMDYLEKADEGDIRPLLRFYFQLLVTDYIMVVSEVFCQEQERFSGSLKNVDEGEISGSELMEYFDILRWFFGLLGELYEGGEMFGEMGDLMNALMTNGN